MTTEERKEIRIQVESEIATLKRSIDTITELTESEVQSDANDWFSSKESNASKEINELALAKARQKLEVLTGVLKRIDNPDFGTCIICKNPIPFERIKAVPSTMRCMSCSR